MKYIITESRLEEHILDYINKLFDVNDINWTNPIEDDDETGEEWEDDNRVVFYVGDYEGEDGGCFYWYACDYFNPNSPASKKCPMVSVELEYKKQLDGYFDNLWHEPFKKWFKEHFELPVKTID
ncbi:MAG: hypothetical protein WCJ72_19175 [Chryseobacterium sp.]